MDSKQSQGFLVALAVIGGGITLNMWMRTSEIAAAAGLTISSRIGTPVLLIGLILVFVAAFMPNRAIETVGKSIGEQSYVEPDWIRTAIWLGFAVAINAMILMND